MKNILFYKSNTGFTKEYCDMLANRIVPLEVYEISKISKKLIKGADNIFFGGPIRNNTILGLDKFLKKYKYMEGKNIFVFAVGIQPPSDEKRELVITTNNLDSYHIRLYLLLGGFDMNRMGKVKQQFMKLGFKAMAKKDPANASLIESRLKNPINFVSSSNLDKMVDTYRRVNLKH